jgi:hypothetical protein
MARTNTKIGDVFSVKINDNQKKYFQLIAFDLTQLNSDVIRAFRKVYKSEDNPQLSSIVNDEVEFYAHCVTKFGLKMGLWELAGNIMEVGDTSQILFRGTSDSGVRAGQEPIRISEKWYVWKINDLDFTSVGKLEGANRTAEIGVVVNPYDILDRIKTGKYNFFYPGFE